MAKTNVRGAQIADGANGVDLTVDVTGVLPAANGGTAVASAGASGNALVSNGTTWTSSASKQDKATLAGLTLQVYGHSYTDDAVMVPGQTPTTAGMYFRRVATALGGNAPVTYGKGGTRIDFSLGSLLNTGTWPGLAVAPVSGSVWPGAAARPGPVVVDTFMNDIAHTNGGLPLAISGASGLRYVAGISGFYEAFCAVVSSESRKDIFNGVAGVTFTGANWSHNNTTVAYLSGATMSSTTGAGQYVEIVLTPEQFGPLSGKVWIGIPQFDPADAGNANINVQIDGGTAVPWTKPQWEKYGGQNLGYAVIPIELPTDTASHTIRLTHAGTTGEYMMVDAAFISSAAPPDIYVMDTPDPVVDTGYTAADVAIWKANKTALLPSIKTAVAKFGNAIWVPCTMTIGTLWVDGIHPQDEGLLQRANDLKSAIVSRTFAPVLRTSDVTAAGRALEQAASNIQQRSLLDVPSFAQVVANPGTKNIRVISPIWGTAMQTLGIVPSTQGANVSASFSTTSIYTQSKHSDLLTTPASTTAVAGWYCANNEGFWRGNAAGLGGFRCIYRFGPATGVLSTSRSFTGLGNTGAPTDVNPSTLVSQIGVGHDAADTQWQIMHNDGSGTATKVSTGIARVNTDRTKVYTLTISCLSNASTVDVTFTDEGTGTTFGPYTISTDLPANTTGLSPRSWCSVGGVSSVIGMGMFGFYGESPT